MSDHDVYGFDVYNVLKYGCKATAWASPTMVCPRLQWAGPTIADLEGQVEVYAPMHREMLRKADTTVTEHRAVAMEQEWKASTLTKLRNKMKSKPLAEDARTRYNNILKSGILDIRCEREFGEELQAMVENEQASLSQNRDLRLTDQAQQFSFLDFAMVQPQGPEIFAAGRIQQLAPRDNAAAVTVPQPAISQKTRDYQAASRESSTEVTSQQVAKAREMVMDEYS